MNKKELIEKIEMEAKKYFVNAHGCHDWSHIERVRNLAIAIGRNEKADLKILELAAVLHDVGRYEEMKAKSKKGCEEKYCHAKEGAKIARDILKKYGLEENEIENVVHCVESHRSRNDLKPKTIEAKCLFDADKIDGLGAIGIGRLFLFAGGYGSKNLYTGNEKRLAKTNKNYSYTKEDSAALEYEIKMKHALKKMLTKTGEEIAKERLDFMKEFFKRFWKEIKADL